MRCKLTALFLALMLLCVPALAEEAASADDVPATSNAGTPFEPAPGDFIGTWVVQYAVQNGTLLPDEYIAGDARAYIVITADSLTSYAGSEALQTVPYVIDGRSLTLTDEGGMTGSFVMDAQNVLSCCIVDVTLLLTRTNAPVYSPFYGDWAPLMIYSLGEPSIPSGDAAGFLYRFDENGFHAVADGEVHFISPCTYAADSCTVKLSGSDIIFSIDGAGLMKGVPAGLDGVMYLIPAAENQ